MSTKKIRWGIMGPGNIARKLANAVLIDPDSEVVSVASKSLERADVFAKEYGIDASESYEAIAARDDIDVIYVATTHNAHFENTKLALENNKHVLVEKPFTVNAKEAKELIALAKQNQLFLMEAVWVRYLPSIINLKKQLDNGIIGDIKLFDVSFCGVAPPKYIERLTRPELAGGVTLDMGIYPITFVNYMMGELPTKVDSNCLYSELGVDEIATYNFQYESGTLANINTSFNLHAGNKAMIYGSTGYIEFPHFQEGQSFTVFKHGGTSTVEESEETTVENHENGFIYQVAEVVKCLLAGDIESRTMSLGETANTMKLMDDMRASWGFKYPFE